MGESKGNFPLIPGVVDGETADVYFLRTHRVLDSLGVDPVVSMVFFASRAGRVFGVGQCLQLLRAAKFEGELVGLEDGDHVLPGENVLLIRSRYSRFGKYETALLGMLSSGTGWASAAEQCILAAGPIPVVSFGARHVHPNVAPIMDAAAVASGCVSCSTSLGASLAGVQASGTMPHAFLLILGDTLKAAEAFDAVMPSDVARIVLVDTFTDEAVESVRVAGSMDGRIDGVRLDTPRERGGVTIELVQEVRARLDLAGFSSLSIFVSGGMDPERIAAFRDAGAPVDGFGVGSYIARAAPVEFTADIREVEGIAVSKRGRLPGLGDVSRLRRLV